MNKYLVLFLGLGLVSSAVMAEKVSTFGCGITKSAFVRSMNKEIKKDLGIDTSINAKGGAGKAIKLVSKGRINIGVGCRPPIGLKGEENANKTHIAWGALVFVVNPKNPISNISLSDAKDIMTGKITNFKEIGGNDQKITVYVRKGKVSGVGYSARMLMFNDKNQNFVKTAKKQKSSGPLRNKIARDLGGFGIDDISSSKKKKNIKTISIDGVSASKANIQSGKYPLYRPFYIYTKGTLTGNIKKYYDYALSAKGQSVISKAGTVNLEEGSSLKIKY